ncbi:MAG: imidazolonepropionase [Synergistaceae bacterium]|nr:imidazolonepropionase [Synergistaceae bacterium]
MTIKLFRHAAIYTPLTGAEPAPMPRVAEWRDGAMLVSDGRVVAAGEGAEVERAARHLRPDVEVDLEGAAAVPGFVDPHTHACFAERREAEFSMRLAGTPYLDILRAGGGILSSVRSVRAASEDALFRAAAGWLAETMRYGTTTVEVKSGYGLDTGEELRMLRVIDRLGRETPQTVVPTFMGAHAVPEWYNSDSYTRLVCDEMLPAVAEQGTARFCDVFCEREVFSVPQAREMLSRAAELGLGLKIHADEVNDLGGAALAGELHAVSAEHLLAASDEGLDAMAKGGVIAVLLPATAYSLRKPFARARDMIERGVTVALATDLNPGSCFCQSMPFVISLAIMCMGLTPDEALAGATLNAARAIGMEAQVGSLEPGKLADFVVLDGSTPATLAYASGSRPVRSVWKMGERIA